MTCSRGACGRVSEFVVAPALADHTSRVAQTSCVVHVGKISKDMLVTVSEVRVIPIPKTDPKPRKVRKPIVVRRRRSA